MSRVPDIESFRGALAVTPSDTVDLVPSPTRGIYIGTTGNLKVTMRNGDTPTFNSIQAGVFHDLAVTRVWATGTTATNIVAVY